MPGRAAPAEETPTRLARSVAGGEIQQRGHGSETASPASAGVIAEPTVAEEEYGQWTERCARIRSDGELLDLAIRRSIADLRLLRNDGPMRGEHYVAAGIPWFTTLFGRDSIITALQVLPFMPDVARETLRVLADWQATEDDPDRDMEPGKILHELRVGELARTGELPHRPYYGSHRRDAAVADPPRRDVPLDRRPRPRPLGLAERARRAAWIDTYGDRDGDGFVEYERRTPAGLLNQGWKDSGDAIRHRDGSLAVAPIALVEIQGYVYDAKLRMAVAGAAPGRRDPRGPPRVRGGELYRRFDDAFWMADTSFYAIALDRDKRQVGTIGSNPGHCLWSGIVPPERVDAVVDRLLDPAMDCGWGIRTYAAGQPGYNPVGYHTGTVWPHDNALIAAGMKRVGPARRGRSRRLADLRGGPALARLPAAGAVLRLRPRARRRAGPLPRRVLAAGVVGGDLAVAAADDARDARRRRARRPRARPAAPAGVARQGHGPRPARRASAPWTSCSTAGAATRPARKSCGGTVRWSS